MVRGLYLIFFLLSREAFVSLTVNIIENKEVKLFLTPVLLESVIEEEWWDSGVGQDGLALSFVQSGDPCQP